MTLWLFLEKNKVIKFSAIQFPTRKSVEESYILQVKLHEAEATCLLGPLPFVSFKFKDLVAEQATPIKCRYNKQLKTMKQFLLWEVWKGAD